MTGRVLVVGFGNALRSDDGVGWHVAERLADDPRFAAVDVLRRHQLTPELALDVSRASFVIFVDASRAAPGLLAIEPVERAAGRGVAAWTHHFDPATLLALAADLYGATPDAVAVSVGVASLEMGESLSPAVEGAMDRVADAVAGLVAGRGLVAADGLVAEAPLGVLAAVPLGVLVAVDGLVAEAPLGVLAAVPAIAAAPAQGSDAVARPAKASSRA